MKILSADMDNVMFDFHQSVLFRSQIFWIREYIGIINADLFSTNSLSFRWKY